MHTFMTKTIFLLEQVLDRLEISDGIQDVFTGLHKQVLGIL